MKVQFHNKEGDLEFMAAALHVDGHRQPSQDDLRRRLRVPAEAVTTATPKLTIPRRAWSTTAAAGRRSTRASTRTWTVLGRPRGRIPRAGRRLGDAGCTYLQFDDTSLAYLNDPEQRAHVASTGGDPTASTSELHPAHQRGARRPARGHAHHHAHVPRQLPHRRGSPQAATTSSPRRSSTSSTSTASSWSGTTRAPAASSRCASCPKGKLVVLGLVTTKQGELETKDELKRRIEEASRYVDRRSALPVTAVRLLLDRRGQRAPL